MRIVENGVICPGVGLWDIESNMLIPESEITRTTISQQALREYSGRDFTAPPHIFKQMKNSVFFWWISSRSFRSFFVRILSTFELYYQYIITSNYIYSAAWYIEFFSRFPKRSF